MKQTCIWLVIVLTSFCVYAEEFTGVSGIKIDMELDSNGIPHIVYQDKYSTTVYYLTKENGQWISRHVQGSENTTNRFYPRISVDNQGNPHIVWADKGMTQINYNSFQNGAWTGVEVALRGVSGGNDTNRCDVSVDSLNRVIVVAQSDFAIMSNFKKPHKKFGNSYSVLYHHPTDEPKYPTISSSHNGESICLYSHQGIMNYQIFKDRSWSGKKPLDGINPCCVNYINSTYDRWGNAHVSWITWSAGGEYDSLWYSLDGSTENIVSENDYFYCGADECVVPGIAVADDMARVIVYSAIRDNTKAYYNVNGSDFAIANSSEQSYPAIDSIGNTFHIVWSDIRNDKGIYYTTISFSNNPTETPTVFFPTQTPTPDPISSPTTTPTHTECNACELLRQLLLECDIH